MAHQTYPTPSFGPTAPQYGPPSYGGPAGFGQAPAPRKRTGAIIGAVAPANRTTASRPRRVTRSSPIGGRSTAGGS